MGELNTFKAETRQTSEFTIFYNEIKIFSEKWREYIQSKSNSNSLFRNSNAANATAEKNTPPLNKNTI